MNEQKNNGRGIFYGVIGVATLVVAIIGATFAYFTATATNDNTIQGNMATVKLGLDVTKVTTVDETKNGMIPMSNTMVETAVNKTTADTVCVDDNGNAVCQIYKITVTNDSTAAQFIDGYVALRGGSGAPTDFTEYVSGAKVDATKATSDNGTTMRWAQVFVSGNGYTTAGDQIVGTSDEKMTYTAIGQGQAADSTGLNKTNILTTKDAIMGSRSISGNTYDVIKANYIRVSNHAWSASADVAESYDRTADITSALIINQNLQANAKSEFYIVVWLAETGTNQTAGAATDNGTNPVAEKFFNGNVTFVSAQGSEVSATFQGFAKVQSDQTTGG